MRNCLTYLAILSIFMVFSCQKHNPEDQRGEHSDCGVISFSTKVQTRSPLITELNGEHFGVYAYGFSNLTNWNTYKSAATPNVFYNLDVACDGENGACSYNVDTATDINGLEQWILKNKYAFFAYYPYNQGLSSITPSLGSAAGVPYIEYTAPFSTSGSVNTDNLLDIMTAKVIDYSVTQGTEVRFEFNHRLYCIDLYSQNFNTDDVQLTDLTMTVSGIHYNKTQLYLDPDVPSVSTAVNNWKTSNKVTFPICSSATVTAGAPAMYLSGEQNQEKLVVLIPQDSSPATSVGLTVELNFKKDGTAVDPRKQTFNVDFKPGKKYSLTINFVGEDVIMVMSSPAPWDKKDVTHTFN